MLHQRHQLAAVLHHVAAVRELDLAGVDLLEPRDQRQRHRLGLRRAGAEHQQRRRLFVGRGVPAVGGFVGGHLRGDGAAERLRDAVRIDDHDHRAVAEDGVAGEHRDVAQLARHRLDHDFLGVEHAVDDDAEGLAADLRDDDEAVLDDRLASASMLEQLAQARPAAAACRASRSTAASLMRSMRCSRLGARAHQLDHGELRDGEALAAGLDDQRRDDRERERNLDGEARALARRPTSRRWCRRSGRYWCAPRPCRRRGRTRW